MRTRLVALLLPIALLLGAPSPATEIRDKAKRAAYEAEGLALCQAAMAQGRPGDFEAGDAEQGCRCTIRLFMTGKTIGQLPPLELASLRTTMGDELGQCAERLGKIGVKREVTESAGADRAPSTEAAPGTVTTMPTPAPAAEPSATARSWSLPSADSILAYLRSVPLWALGAIALAILLLALRKLVRRDDRRDLTGVPPSLRPGGYKARRPEPPIT